MSKEYDNEMTFVLFRNDKAETDKHPSHTGKITMNGKEYRLAAWVKDGKKGKFFSGKVSEFDQGQQQSRQAAAPADDHFDDRIPF